MGDEVIPLGETRRPAGGDPVVLNGGLMITRQLEQMRANCIQAMMAGQASIRFKRIQQIESVAGPCTITAAIA